MSGPLSAMSDVAWLRARYRYDLDADGHLIDLGPRVRADRPRRAPRQPRAPRPPRARQPRAPRPPGYLPPAVARAVEWLGEYLAACDGAVPSVLVKADGLAAGFSVAVLKRAALVGGITVEWVPAGVYGRYHATVWSSPRVPGGSAQPVHPEYPAMSR